LQYFNIRCILLVRKEAHMRLIENPDTWGCSPSEVMVLVRHGADASVLSKELNQPLTEETKPDIKVLGKQIIRLCSRIGVQNARIRHSNRLRAIQTAAIIAEEFFSANIPTEMIEAVGIREIDQGNFLIKDHIHGSEYKPLVDAWRAWQQKLDAFELLYRFGDPILSKDKKAHYPELVGWFKKFGEHQGEFSLRLYLLMKEVFEDPSDCLQVIVGHQASCSRIQRTIDMMLRVKSPNEFKSGEFVKFLEKKGSRTTIEAACGIVLKKPDRDLAVQVIQKEIGYLRSII